MLSVVIFSKNCRPWRCTGMPMRLRTARIASLVIRPQCRSDVTGWAMLLPPAGEYECDVLDSWFGACAAPGWSEIQPGQDGKQADVSLCLGQLGLDEGIRR